MAGPLIVSSAQNKALISIGANRETKMADWSKLSPDLLHLILDSLSSKDFHRARSVCPDWYSVSKRCTRDVYPWRILSNDASSTSLFDPEEDKIQIIKHPKIDVWESYVIATCSSWLLMADSDLDFYILNAFTRERINIPSVESLVIGQARFKQKDMWQQFTERISSKPPAVLWINERTHDYFVAWSYKQEYLFSYKRGYDSWCNLEGAECISMGYKNKKLFVYTFDHFIKIFDFSGDYPEEIIEGNLYCNHRFDMMFPLFPRLWKRRIAITNSEDVLIVLSLQSFQKLNFFAVYKMDFVSGKWERISSLGGDVLLFGHGVTFSAPVKSISDGGIKGDTIYFLSEDLRDYPSKNSCDPDRKTNCGVFDLVTSTITWPAPDAAQYRNSLWFFPGCV